MLPANAFVVVSSVCPRCEGKGRINLQQPGTMPTPAQCESCQGIGFVSSPITLEDLGKALLPILFPPTETPPASEPAPAAEASDSTTNILPLYSPLAAQDTETSF